MDPQHCFPHTHLKRRPPVIVYEWSSVSFAVKKFREADVRKECEDVYSVPLVERDLCRRLLEEVLVATKSKFRENSHFAEDSILRCFYDNTFSVNFIVRNLNSWSFFTRSLFYWKKSIGIFYNEQYDNWFTTGTTTNFFLLALAASANSRQIASWLRAH